MSRGKFLELAGQHYEVASFSSDAFFAALANDWITSAEVADIQQVRYLVDYLNHFKTETIVIEHGYVDRDYLEDYASYYVGNYQPYPKLTKRLHFFTDKIGEDELQKGLLTNDADSIARLKNSYAGFIVARPLPSAVVGRTILKTYETGSPDGQRFYPVKREYQPHLFGILLPIESLAYQQQDRAVAACATVALWSAFHKTEILFDSARPTPAEITRVANSVRGSHRAMPSRNLNPEQMAEAVRHVGLEPELVEIQHDTPLSSLIYSYVSYGVPVILLVHIDGKGGHAMTVTGYRLGDKIPAVTEPFTNIPYVGRLIDELFVHDDNIGPFAHLRIVAVPDDLKTSQDELTADAFGRAPYALEIEARGENNARTKLLCAPQLAIVPVYPKIRLNFVALHGWLDKYASVLEEYASKLGIDPKELRWTVQLDSSNAFKIRLRNENPIGISSILIRPYPRYIWRTVIEMGGRKLVELTIDATEIAQAFPFLDAVHYDIAFGAELRRFFSLKEVRDLWTPVIGSKFVDFLSQGTSEHGLPR